MKFMHSDNTKNKIELLNDRLIKSHSVYMENYRIEFAKQTKFYNCRYRPSAT